MLEFIIVDICGSRKPACNPCCRLMLSARVYMLQHGSCHPPPIHTDSEELIDSSLPCAGISVKPQKAFSIYLQKTDAV